MLVVIASVLIISAFPLAAAEKETVEAESVKIPVPQTKISYNWFRAYLTGQEKGTDINEFQVRRGYININSKFNDWFSTRITPDVTTDSEGDGQGDIEMCLKYAYVKFSMPSKGVFTKPAIEFGLVHRPWLDFEQKING